MRRGDRVIVLGIVGLCLLNAGLAWAFLELLGFI
jgi:hypothetical protein